MEVLGEKLRGEEHFVDKPAQGSAICALGGGQLALARCDQDAVDAVGKLKVSCVRPESGLGELRSLGKDNGAGYRIRIAMAYYDVLLRGVCGDTGVMFCYDTAGHF